MLGDDGKERLWRRLVIPILWPVAAAQGVLLALCLVLALSLHWLMPAASSWSTTLWMITGLLVGTALNIMVFLVLLKHRLAEVERDLGGLLDRVEACLHQVLKTRTGKPADAAGAPVDRVETLLDAFESSAPPVAEAPPPMVGLGPIIHADQVNNWQQESRRLEAALSRAREESRLKSSYLSHLSKALAPLVVELESLMQADGSPSPQAGSQQESRRAADTETVDGVARPSGELLRRLGDIRLLLDNLEAGDEEERSAARDSSPRHQAPKVLIVDDGPVNLMLAREVLERRGVDVVTATRGEEALEWLDAHVVDLVLMDIVLPDIDGIETSRRLRAVEAAHPERPRAVVIALTANASDEDQQRFKEVGMDAFLAKPYRPQALLELLDTWLPQSARLS
ncbi:MAG: response regulator [Pseudomonadota bacterium]|nr:response regulator [Pseudomonadota bacterium]